jgi:histidyl-tRNA synthetase
LKIPYKINPFLVRGLDYYNHCVFEFKTTSLGAQDAILSGGRYDHLVAQMGGPQTPGFGWAAGLERLALLSPLEAKAPRPIAVIPVHGSAERDAFRITCELRDQGFTCEIGFSGNLSKRMKKAAAQNAWAAVLIGPDELARQEVTVKLLDDGSQVPAQLTDLQNFLKSKAP